MVTAIFPEIIIFLVTKSVVIFVCPIKTILKIVHAGFPH